MARHKYTVTSDEGADYANRGRDADTSPVAAGDVVTLDLDAETRRAVIAAGWVEPADTKGGD